MINPFRQYLIDNGLVRPASHGLDDFTPSHGHGIGPVLRLDETGRRVAAQRVALGLRGERDDDRMFAALSFVPRERSM